MNICRQASLSKVAPFSLPYRVLSCALFPSIGALFLLCEGGCNWFATAPLPPRDARGDDGLDAIERESADFAAESDLVGADGGEAAAPESFAEPGVTTEWEDYWDISDIVDFVDIEEPEMGLLCGNGAVESSEECDNNTVFCSSCEIACPSEWVLCRGSRGPACLLIEKWSGIHTREEFRNHSHDIISGLSPVDFEFYGLSVFDDSAIWNCIRPSLDTSRNYWVGLRQDLAFCLYYNLDYSDIV